MIRGKNMKWIRLKEILSEEFPDASSYSEDYIGEQVIIKEEILKILITLDITIDVIAQSKDKNVDLIISHHPLFFGDKKTLLHDNKMLNAKYKLLKNLNIGVFIIHTNADFNPNSISYMQALAIGLENIEQGNQNLHIKGNLPKEIQARELIEIIKENLELNDIKFRINFDLESPVKDILIASGASGGEIDNFNQNIVNIIGEVKHHEWVLANEMSTNVIEISHYSEKIFKNIVNIFLENEKNIEVILSEETNGYKII